MALTLTPTQQQASSPDRSVWLAAHAGTGKTKVLVDRIARLLLAEEAPESILAITYTRAAAAEMQQRVRDKLRHWHKTDEETLRAELGTLLQREASAEECATARGLIFALLDAPKGLAIQTIHGFCQGLLARFPLEAGIGPNLSLMDERQENELLQQARQQLFALLEQDQADATLIEAHRLLAMRLSDDAFQSMLRELYAHHRELFDWLSQPDGALRYRHALREFCEGLEFAPFAQLSPLHEADCWPELIEWLQSGGKNAQALAEALAVHRTAPPQDEAAWLAYGYAFLTQKGEPNQRLLVKAMRETRPDLTELVLAEQEWAATQLQRRANALLYETSDAMLMVMESLLAVYQSLKESHGLLDFNDLIGACEYLLTRPGYCEWVLSKLDYSLKHVLLDEAQDTSPQQWRLMHVLVEELLVPALYEGSPRSLFVVGDRKQSIYRFQGADPEGFNTHQLRFAQWFEQTGQAFDRLTLEQSFRSAPNILALVDRVCAQQAMRAALASLSEEIRHQPHRQNTPGYVQLWPLCEGGQRAETVPPWELSAPDYAQANPRFMLADQMAETIAEWLAQGRVLESKQRAVEPGDILILVRQRKAMVRYLTQCLQQRGVPVAGADRLHLHSHLAYQDVMALAQWALNPADDLSLAVVLKGPLCRISEERLFELAYARDASSLWDRLHTCEDMAGLVDFLQRCHDEARHARPFDWLAMLVDESALVPQLVAELGAEVIDMVHELQQQALRYEQEQVPSLQGFVAWMDHHDVQIKRELQQGLNAVRIMTVHGAKGLQAPIVLLPDTTSLPRARSGVRWLTSRAGHPPLGLLMPPNEMPPPLYAALKDQTAQQEQEEYQRLLYVALTRAEDELYIAGVQTGNSIPEACWYETCRAALQSLGAQETDGALVLGARSTQLLPRQEVSQGTFQTSPTIATLPSQDRALPPLSPSQLVAHDEPASSAVGADSLARKRGDWLHQLLQVLPSSDQPLDVKALQSWLRYQSVPEALQDGLIEEAMRLWSHADYRWLFAPNSRAEVAVQGRVMWEGQPRLMRGHIDRLVVEETRLVIVDYKTRAGGAEAEMPRAYAYQLASYAALLAPSYPDKRIEAALLYTAQPTLQWVDAAFLETVCQELRVRLD